MKFVTFIDPAAAISFYNLATLTGIALNNRRLKVGWGKHSGPLAPSLALSIQAGATRNVYVGNIEDFEKFSVEKLKRDFGEYGEIELVNYLKEKYAFRFPRPGRRTDSPSPLLIDKELCLC